VVEFEYLLGRIEAPARGWPILKFEHGLYQIQDDAFADWRRNQELDE
jgi:hypothetical protein